MSKALDDDFCAPRLSSTTRLDARGVYAGFQDDSRWHFIGDGFVKVSVSRN